MITHNGHTINEDYPCEAPGCNGHMVERKNRKNGDIFYGCSNYPKCTYTLSEKVINNWITYHIIGEVSNEEIDEFHWDRLN